MSVQYSDVVDWLTERAPAAQIPKVCLWKTRWTDPHEADIQNPNVVGLVVLLGCIAAIANVDAVYCYRQSSVVCLSVCLSAGHVHEPCKNGGTDPDADWRIDSGGPKEPCIRWVQIQIPQGKGQFLVVVRPIETEAAEGNDKWGSKSE